MVFRIQVLGRATGTWPAIGWLVRWLQSDSVPPLLIREPIKLQGLRLRQVLPIRRPSAERLLASSPCLPDDEVARNVRGSAIGCDAALKLHDKDVCSPARVTPIAGKGD